MTHAELVDRGRRWLANKCPVVLTEIATSVSEQPDVFGLGYQSSALTVILEAKVSHADFLADKTKSFRRCPENGLGDLRFYLTTPGTISRDELPFGWGLLEARESARGSGVRMTASAFQQEKKSTTRELLILISAFRRLQIPEGRHVSVRVYKWAQEAPRTTLTVKDERRWSVRELLAIADRGSWDDNVWGFLNTIEEVKNEVENTGSGHADSSAGPAVAVDREARDSQEQEGEGR